MQIKNCGVRTLLYKQYTVAVRPSQATENTRPAGINSRSNGDHETRKNRHNNKDFAS